MISIVCRCSTIEVISVLCLEEVKVGNAELCGTEGVWWRVVVVPVVFYGK